MCQFKLFVSQLLLKELSFMLGNVKVKKSVFAKIGGKENIRFSYFNTLLITDDAIQKAHKPHIGIVCDAFL